MSKILIKDIEPEKTIQSYFLVKSKEIKQKKNQDKYLSLNLADKCGEIQTVMWEGFEDAAKSFTENDFVKIQGIASYYQGNLQLTLDKLRKAEVEEIDMKDFLPETEKDVEFMFEELRVNGEKIKNPYLKELLLNFFNDGEFVNSFKQAPAAKGVHHVYLGGLLEHTYYVVNISIIIAKHYEGINEDLLIATAILHDIGKIKELKYDKIFDYSDEGRLIGHIYMGAEMIQKMIDRIPGFPEELSMLIKHSILSHHGELEFGSPKRPKTIEALILHYTEDLDAKINAYTTFIKKHQAIPGNWTPFHKVFDRFIFKKGFQSLAEKESNDISDESETEEGKPGLFSKD